MLTFNVLTPPSPIDVSAEFTRASLPWWYAILDDMVADHSANEREAFLDGASRLPPIKFIPWPYPRYEIQRG